MCCVLPLPLGGRPVRVKIPREISDNGRSDRDTATTTTKAVGLRPGTFGGRESSGDTGGTHNSNIWTPPRQGQVETCGTGDPRQTRRTESRLKGGRM